MWCIDLQQLLGSEASSWVMHGGNIENPFMEIWECVTRGYQFTKAANNISTSISNYARVWSAGTIGRAFASCPQSGMHGG